MAALAVPSNAVLAGSATRLVSNTTRRTNGDNSVTDAIIAQDVENFALQAAQRGEFPSRDGLSALLFSDFHDRDNRILLICISFLSSVQQLLVVAKLL